MAYVTTHVGALLMPSCTKKWIKPNIMYQTDHPAYKKLQEIGKEITAKVRPKAVVVFSAHWQAGRNKLEVNTAEKTDLIYEYVEIDQDPHIQ